MTQVRLVLSKESVLDRNGHQGGMMTRALVRRAAASLAPVPRAEELTSAGDDPRVLRALVRAPAASVHAKYICLDARDKLLRRREFCPAA